MVLGIFFVGEERRGQSRALSDRQPLQSRGQSEPDKSGPIRLRQPDQFLKRAGRYFAFDLPCRPSAHNRIQGPRVGKEAKSPNSNVFISMPQLDAEEILIQGMDGIK